MLKRLCCLTLIFSLSATSNPVPQKDEHKIHNVITAMVSAWNEKDMYYFARHFTDDASFITIFGEYFATADAIKNRRVKLHEDHTSTLFTNRYSDISLSMIHDDVARAIIRWTVLNTQGALHGIWTLIFVRVGEEWRIASAHNTKTELPTYAGSKL